MHNSKEIERDSFYIEASAVNTYLYCPRRCYYEYVQNEFESNVHTILGDQVHENVDDFGEVDRRGRVIYKAVKIISDKYQVTLKVDTVEEWQGEIYPVEYKKGKKSFWKNDRYQLALQGMLLEEKLDRKIDKGYIYYVSSRERVEIAINDGIKLEIQDIITKIKDMYNTFNIPKGVNDNRCKYCSIKNICLPEEIILINKIREGV